MKRTPLDVLSIYCDMQPSKRTYDDGILAGETSSVIRRGAVDDEHVK